MELSRFKGIIDIVSMELRFNWLIFCRNTLLRAFYKVHKKIAAKWSKGRGGGNGFLNCVKKNCKNIAYQAIFIDMKGNPFFVLPFWSNSEKFLVGRITSSSVCGSLDKQLLCFQRYNFCTYSASGPQWGQPLSNEYSRNGLFKERVSSVLE